MDLKKELNKRILLVDDEPKILEELQKVLMPAETTGKELKELQGRLFGESASARAAKTTYDVHCCRQGDEALEAVQQSLERNEPFAVAFLDVRMPPGPDGVRTAEQIRQIDPNLQIVMMTGYSDFDISEIAKRVPPEDKLLYIEKPIHTQEIRQFALALTAKWQSDYPLHQQNNYLIEVNQQLIEHDRMKSEFVMTVSHELRTPLTIFKNIISNAIAGVSGKISQKLEHDLKMADEAVDRLASIISDFLDISKLDVGKMKLHQDVLCVQKIFGDISEMAQFMTDNKNIRFDVEMPPDDLHIYADIEKITRIINNLIENAAKFVPEGIGEITIRVEEIGGDHIGICVTDNGPGVHGDDKEKIFDPFVQIEKHVGPGKHGTGLGLSICRELISLHRGYIWVEDNPAGGAAFKMLLPKWDIEEDRYAIAEIPQEQAVTV